MLFFKSDKDWICQKCQGLLQYNGTCDNSPATVAMLMMSGLCDFFYGSSLLVLERGALAA